MSTRCAIRTTTRAVYVHFDGYPSNIAPLLYERVRALGEEAALAAVMSYDWSTLLESPISKGPDEGWDLPDRNNLGPYLDYVYDVNHQGVIVRCGIDLSPIKVAAWNQDLDWSDVKCRHDDE